jgi:hypothetical protein
MLRVAFAGTFAARLEPRVRAHLEIPCDVIAGEEQEIVRQLPEVDVLVTLAFTAEMGAAGMLEARARLIAGNIQRAAPDEPPVNLIS